MNLWVLVYRYQQGIAVFTMIAANHDEAFELAKKLLSVSEQAFEERFMGVFPVHIPDKFELAPAGTGVTLDAHRRGGFGS